MSLTSSFSSAISFFSFASFAVSSSMDAVKVSTLAVRSSRDCLLVASSSSHQPLWSASSFASVMSLTNKSLIIFLTLAKGSSVIRAAIESKKPLRTLSARCRRSVAARTWALAPAIVALSAFWNCAKTVAGDTGVCTRAAPGRCLSAAPDTCGLEMISMAFWIACNSSFRNNWRDSNSSDFLWQVAVISCKYFSSAALLALVSARSPFAVAASCNLLAFAAAFLLTVASAYSVSS
mmetsp:Transcript_59886/g.115515  ORF Transcript_59886/g.115515 Transcript_59886/m.115515 type:complete len:235 (+) Transcript_59886:589-1293(+)